MELVMAFPATETKVLPILIEDNEPRKYKKIKEVAYTPRRSLRFPRRSACLLSLTRSAAVE